ncbi:MAG: hypothetical protein IPM69_08330 [Ignavibacteria bacterium]|nr:hypothetical protein [Ignavibacteria bacterium]
MMNDYSEMIHRYLDGDLPEAAERLLFDELARNPELRRDFGLELEVQKLVAKDSTTLLAPDNVRAGVFSSLNIPLTTDATTIAAAAAPQLLTFTSIALVSMLFGGIMVWFGIKANDSFTSQLSVTASNTEKIMSSAIPATMFTNDMDNTQTVGNNSRKYNYNSMNSTTALQPIIVKNPLDYIQSSESYITTPIISAVTTSSDDIQHLNQSNRDSYFAQSLSIPQLIDIHQDIPMTVSVRGMQDIAGANGVALSALYALDDEQAIGVEVSTDRFTRYEQRRIDGVDKRIAFSEPSTIIGSVYRIALPSMSIDEFTPYIQSFAGATTKGLPVGRATVGLQWTPDRRVTLSGGIDGTIFGYQTNGQWKAGVMTSVVYGVSVVW